MGLLCKIRRRFFSILLCINIICPLFCGKSRAIDFNYEDKKEIIKIKNNKGETKEEWTGNYLFENEWQSFKTKKKPELDFISIPHQYKEKGKYKVMVKVIDILGIDTSRIFEVQI